MCASHRICMHKSRSRVSLIFLRRKSTYLTMKPSSIKMPTYFIAINFPSSFRFNLRLEEKKKTERSVTKKNYVKASIIHRNARSRYVGRVLPPCCFSCPNSMASKNTINLGTVDVFGARNVPSMLARRFCFSNRTMHPWHVVYIFQSCGLRSCATEPSDSRRDAFTGGRGGGDENAS